MDADWIKSPSARRVFMHWADLHPAWLWSGDGASLLWWNRAAGLFARAMHRAGDGRATEAVPIRGQVARLIRLGSAGQASPSRMQFLVGQRPVSITCNCTPLPLAQGGMGLLIVADDALELRVEQLPADPEPVTGGVFPPNAEYLLLDAGGHVAEGSAVALRDYAPRLEANGLTDLPVGTTGVVDLAGGQMTVTRFAAGPRGESLLLFETIAAAAVPAGTVPEPIVAPDAEDWPESIEMPEAARRSLSSLFDRLAHDAELYTGLEQMPSPGTVAPASAADPAEDEWREDFELGTAGKETASEAGELPPIAELPTTPEAAGEAEPNAPTLFKVVGRGFEPLPEAGPAASGEPPEPGDGAVAHPPLPPRDAEAVERVSRYNFDELSRILNDRVGAGEPAARPGADPTASPARPAAVAGRGREGQLVSLAGESFILNRLPLGILVFRDQQVLFANRAITEMTGYSSVEELRGAGLGSMFPATGEGQQAAGPVNHLMQRDGTLVPVTARLQSISWQGRPALMLSASTTEVRTGHEAAVKAFAQLLAESRQEGFLELSRNGVVSHASGRARLVLGRPDEQIVGKPLSALVAASEAKALQAFLERPARFAETARPAIALTGSAADIDVLVFAQGQAGVVTGYFALVRKHPGATPAALPPPVDVEPAVLARLSRGVRRPLNTIIGFADLMHSAAFGHIGNERYIEYARDIRAAGQEIAGLVDELDDFTRLKEGRYPARRAEVDLRALLDSCIVRMRAQAGAARVLVRSAISEKLPRVRADRASLGQALLNLLASAIDQTPSGGSVILSAQLNEDGSINVNVRGSGTAGNDPAERFVVFREPVGRAGETLAPVHSSVGLALTRSLLGVNAFSLSVDPVGENGTMFSLAIPSGNVTRAVASALE